MAGPNGPRTREDLVALIAGALQRSLRYLSDQDARAAADTVLREMRAARLRIIRRGDDGSSAG